MEPKEPFSFNLREPAQMSDSAFLVTMLAIIVIGNALAWWVLS